MTKQERFIKELSDLFEKYNVRIDESDDYNGHDEFCGTQYTIISKKGSDININIDNLQDEIYIYRHGG